MNQPPQHSLSSPAAPSPPASSPPSSPASHRRPAWRLPAGVAPGTWEYTNQNSIASEYQDFLATTPLIDLDTRVVLRELPPPASGRQTRVVDLGCGDGRTLRSLWTAGYDVLGVDLSQPMLRRVIAGEYGPEFCRRLVRANLVELGCLADDSFDHAVCLFSTIGMIRGAKHRRQFIRHVARTVRPGGTFILHVHNRNAAWRDSPSRRVWLQSAWASLTQPGHELGDRIYPYRGLADMFLHTYSLAELRRDLRTSGWQIKRFVPLSPNSDQELSHPHWLPTLRAGGFFAIAHRAS